MICLYFTLKLCHIYIFASSIQLGYIYIKHIINIFNHRSDVKESEHEATSLGFNCDFNTY